MYRFENWLFSMVVSLQKLLAYLNRTTHRKYLLSYILLNLEIRQYLSHFWSDKDVKGTVVNLTLLSLHGGSLEITLKHSPLYIYSAPDKTWQFKDDKKLLLNLHSYFAPFALLPFYLGFAPLTTLFLKSLMTGAVNGCWKFSVKVNVKVKVNKI